MKTSSKGYFGEVAGQWDQMQRKLAASEAIDCRVGERDSHRTCCRRSRGRRRRCTLSWALGKGCCGPDARPFVGGR